MSIDNPLFEFDRDLDLDLDLCLSISYEAPSCVPDIDERDGIGEICERGR